MLTSSAPSRHLRPHGPAAPDEVETQITTSISDIEVSLIARVREIVSELFVLFDFFELSGEVYEEIVTKFVDGEIT
jgi:hypothetical protein